MRTLNYVFLIFSIVLFVSFFSCEAEETLSTTPVTIPDQTGETGVEPEADLSVSPVSNLTAFPRDNEVELIWVNPTDSDFIGAEILFDNKTEETILFKENNSSSIIIDGLNNGIEYSFKLIATDQSGNKSEASTITAIPVPGPAPVFQALPGEYVSGEFLVEIQFTTNVSGFDIDDISPINAKVTDFMADPLDSRFYSIILSPIEEGEVSLSIDANLCQDSNGSQNYASQNPMITRFGSPLKSIDDINIVTITEGSTVDIKVADLTQNDVSSSPSPLSITEIFENSGGTAILTTIATENDTIRFSSTALAGEEAAFSYTADDGYTSAEATVSIYVIPANSPAVIITNKPGSYVNAPFTVTIDFTTEVTGFESNDISLLNAEVSSFSKENEQYTVELTPILPGEISMQIAEDSVFDNFILGNVESELVQLTYGLPVIAKDDSSLEELSVKQNINGDSSKYINILPSILLANDLSNSPNPISITSIFNINGVSISPDISAGIKITETPFAFEPASFSYTVSDNFSTATASVVLEITPLANAEAFIFSNLNNLTWAKENIDPFKSLDIFGDWERTNGSFYYENANAAIQDGVAVMWMIGGSDGRTVNLSPDAPFGSALLVNQSDSYFDLEAKIYSSNRGEQGDIGLVLGFDIENGVPSILVAVRNQTDSASRRWKISIFTDGVETIIEELAVRDYLWSYNWKKTASAIRVERRGNKIKAFTAPITYLTSTPEIVRSTELSIDLSTANLARFADSNYTGYFTLCKKSYFSNIDFTALDESIKLYSLNSDQSASTWRWSINSEAWENSSDPREMQTDFGAVRKIQALPEGFNSAPEPLPTYILYPDRLELTQ